MPMNACWLCWSWCWSWCYLIWMQFMLLLMLIYVSELCPCAVLVSSYFPACIQFLLCLKKYRSREQRNRVNSSHFSVNPAEHIVCFFLTQRFFNFTKKYLLQAKSIMFDLNLPSITCRSKSEILPIGVKYYKINPSINKDTHDHRTKRAHWRVTPIVTYVHVDFCVTHICYGTLGGGSSLLVLLSQVWCHRKLNLDFFSTHGIKIVIKQEKEKGQQNKTQLEYFLLI